MWKTRALALLILLTGLGIGYFVYMSEAGSSRFGFQYGLDISGGTHLVYSADTSAIPASEVGDAMGALRDVIERRVNLFGVSEPLVQAEQSSVFAERREERLIVELPGITDVNEAIRLIGETPTLEFKLVKAGFEDSLALPSGELNAEAFEATGLTGRYLQTAQLQFSNSVQTGGFGNTPYVAIKFNEEGGDLFARITKANVGRKLAIFLDGALIEAPVIQDEITGGEAVISGGFTPESAKALARNLSFGALPVPITLVSTQTIGATLGEEIFRAGIFSGVVGLLAVALFMLLWYRLPGLISVVALSLYVVLMLALFKLIPVVLTAPGIAAFILSIGLAVDANILIFERFKEERYLGKEIDEALHRGFDRAWTSIRDANIAHIISAIILFWFGTSLVKGFALVFGIGTIVSLFSAITVSRSFFFALPHARSRFGLFLLGSGIK